MKIIKIKDIVFLGKKTEKPTTNIYLRKSDSSSPIYENGRQIPWKEMENGQTILELSDRTTSIEIDDIELQPKAPPFTVQRLEQGLTVFRKGDNVLIPASFKKLIESAEAGNYVITIPSIHLSITASTYYRKLFTTEMMEVPAELLQKYYTFKEEVSMADFASQTVDYVPLPVIFLECGIFHETFREQ